MDAQVDLYQTLDLLQDRNIIAWILKNEIKNERGIPISFNDHAFMIDPYLDWTPEQASRKASQCGWSVMTNIKLFYAAKHGIPGHDVTEANVIYTLPSDADVNAFVPSKTNLLIANNPIIRQYIKDDTKGAKDVDSIQRKQIGNSMVYFKGTRSKTAAIMLTADLRIHDESDRSDQTTIDQYESRVSSSRYKGNWTFSNPSAPNMPADLLFQASDQKYWFIRCEFCGKWQYLDWYKLSEYELFYNSSNPHCFVDDTDSPTFGCYVCGHCGRAITDDVRRRGQWINKKVSPISGYWVSQFMYPWISAKQLLVTEANKSKAYFMNFVRGLPYVGSDVVVDAQTIVQNLVLQDNYQWTRGHVAMGVDNGDVKHYVIGDETGIFEVGKTKDWAVIEEKIRKYEPICVIDLNPYPAKPRELAVKYRPVGSSRWRVYCSFYIDESKNYELIDWGTDEKAHMVYPVRNMLFDELIDYIATGNMKFYGHKTKFEEYIAHWETMYRADMLGTQKLTEALVPDITKQVQGKWLSSTGMDHFAHATLYYYVALSKIIGRGGKVISSQSEPTNRLQQVMGSIPTVPVQAKDAFGNDKPNTMVPTRAYIPNIAGLQKKVRKSAAVSDTIR